MKLSDFLNCAEYDGVILDIMLPGITGIGVLKDMRSKGDKTPVLLLTRHGGLWKTEWRVWMPEQTDYLVKPF